MLRLKGYLCHCHPGKSSSAMTMHVMEYILKSRTGVNIYFYLDFRTVSKDDWTTWAVPSKKLRVQLTENARRTFHCWIWYFHRILRGVCGLVSRDRNLYKLIHVGFITKINNIVDMHWWYCIKSKTNERERRRRLLCGRKRFICLWIDLGWGGEVEE